MAQPPAPLTAGSIQAYQSHPGAAPQYGQVVPSPPGAMPSPYAQMPPYIAYPPARPNSGAAIASLVCGIIGVVLFWVWIPFVLSVVAIISGHIALKQTKNNPALGGRGMAFVGLITGYVGAGLMVFQIGFVVISVLFFGALIPIVAR